MSETTAVNYWYKDGSHCGSKNTIFNFKADDKDSSSVMMRQCHLEFSNQYLDQFGDCDYFEITFKVETYTPEAVEKINMSGSTGTKYANIFFEMDEYSDKYDEMEKRHSDKISSIKRMKLGEDKIKKLIAAEKEAQSIEADIESKKYEEYEEMSESKVDEIMKNKPSWVIKRTKDYFRLVNSLVATPELLEKVSLRDESYQSILPDESFVTIEFAARHFPEWDDNKLLTILDIRPVSGRKLELINEENRKFYEHIHSLQEENDKRKPPTREEMDKWRMDRLEEHKNRELNLDAKSIDMGSVVTIPDMFTCPVCIRLKNSVDGKTDTKLTIVREFEYELETDYKIETKVGTCRLPISITCEYKHSWYPCHRKDHHHRIFSGKGEVDIMNSVCRCKCYWKDTSTPPPWIALVTFEKS